MTTVLNLIVIAVLLIPTVLGLKNGFVKTAAHLLRFVLAFAVASAFSKSLSQILLKTAWLQGMGEGLAGPVSVVVSFVALFVLSLILLGLIARFLTLLIEKIPIIGALNHILGLALGFLQGIFAAWIAAQVLVLILPVVSSSIDVFSASVLKFFYDINPVRLLLEVLAK